MSTAAQPAVADTGPVVEVRSLSRTFDVSKPWLNRVLERSPKAFLKAAQDISFSISKGETFALVGESGSGKSTVARCVMRLIDPTDGSIRVAETEIARLSRRELRPFRRHIQIVFQDPFRSLNPRWTIGRSLIEGPLNLGADKHAALARARELLTLVGLPDDAVDRYPHQFSGGMRQRVVIALALAAEPQLIVADEPTTALDVSIQAQIIQLLKKVCRERGAAVMLITHDMGVIAETCDRVAVMYAGRIAEIGPVHEVINHPAHPYTVGLMASIPDMEQDREMLSQIDGAMPRLNAIPRGCAFNPRCPRVFDRCRVERPDLMPAGATRAACWLHATDGEGG